MSPVNSITRRQRGRPRDVAARDAALKKAAELFATQGMGAVTMEAVARLTGVGKPTLYRNWRNREELIMAALMNEGAPRTSVKETATAEHDLLRHVQKFVSAFTQPKGRNLALMVASADQDSELSKAFRNQVMLASREEGRAIILRGRDDGSYRRSIDVEAVLDMIYGPIFYRLLIGHQQVTESFVKTLLAEIKKGIGH